MKNRNINMVCADLKFERRLQKLAEAKKAEKERKKKLEAQNVKATHV